MSSLLPSPVLLHSLTSRPHLSREVTFGQIRSNVENELGLEANILKTAEYKRLVKEMITSATVRCLAFNN